MRQGWAVWITGLPASGKSTISRHLSERLAARGVRVQVLESDTLRTVLTPHPTYDPEEREAFYNALVYIGGLLSKNGVNVIFDATANQRTWRDRARQEIPAFLEVHVQTPLEVCEERDPKGIYRKAAEGQAQTVPGRQAPYEEPLHAEVTVTGTQGPEESAKKILEAMNARGMLRPNVA
jgi:adenylylsulfate kinase